MNTSKAVKSSVIEAIRMTVFDSLITDNTYIHLMSICKKGNRLFLDGIAFISGVSVKDYSDIDYKLVLEGEKTYILQLAKAYRPEITEVFSKDKDIFYDTCCFTTFKYAGIDLSEIPNGDYKISLRLESENIVKQQKIRARNDIDIENEIFFTSLTEENNVVLIDSIKISADPGLREVFRHTKDKQIINKGFVDDAGNELISIGNTENCFIKILGSNNKIEINKNSNIKNLFIEILGNNSYVKIGENVKFFGNIRLGFECEVVIGNGVSSTNAVYVTCAEKTKVLIGDDCMFATNNQIRTDDAHPIYDVSNGKRINYSRDVVIGNHVWIGYGVTLFGGSNVGNGTVIGAFSLVNKKIPNNCVIAGSPARVIKKNVFWERSPLLLQSEEPLCFSEDNMKEKSYCNYTKD